MGLVEQNSAFKGVDVNLVRRRIIKQKNLLKRNKAKNRGIIRRDNRPIIELADDSEDVEEFKKQRNRISAQASRDKKKEKVKALEELNQQLQQ
jgi:hypothetical protein